MVLKVIWTGPAKAELRDIREYIAGDNPAAAKKVVREITERTRARHDAFCLSGL